jgi:hypothetical protein
MMTQYTIEPARMGKEEDIEGGREFREKQGMKEGLYHRDSAENLLAML